jgi:hypothetical protein
LLLRAIMIATDEMTHAERGYCRALNTLGQYYRWCKLPEKAIDEFEKAWRVADAGIGSLQVPSSCFPTFLALFSLYDPRMYNVDIPGRMVVQGRIS